MDNNQEYKLFVWDEDISVGIPNVDKQHGKLVEMVNRLGGCLSEKTLTYPKMRMLIGELYGYTAYHFRDEEMIMSKYNLSPRHLDKHLEYHDSFLSEVRKMDKELKREKDSEEPLSKVEYEKAEDVLQFLVNWLIYHIVGCDKYMANQVRLIKNGVNPDEAYDAVELERDSQSSVLIKALNGLFETVKKRNHELDEINKNLHRIVDERTRELVEKNEYLELILNTDHITGLASRRYAIKSMEIFWKRAISENADLSVIIIDLDKFKEVNDTFGHYCGDFVLAEFARVLKGCMRNSDIVCRLGGDEFMVILPDTNLKDSIEVAKKIHQKINTIDLVYNGHSCWKGQASLGVATMSKEMQTYKDLIKKADDYAYMAKSKGRNNVQYGS